MASFHKKSIAKMIPQNKFRYGTVYYELLRLIFQFFTNYIKDLRRRDHWTPPPPTYNSQKVQPLSD